MELWLSLNLFYTWPLYAVPQWLVHFCQDSGRGSTSDRGRIVFSTLGSTPDRGRIVSPTMGSTSSRQDSLPYSGFNLWQRQDSLPYSGFNLRERQDKFSLQVLPTLGSTKSHMDTRHFSVISQWRKKTRKDILHVSDPYSTNLMFELHILWLPRILSTMKIPLAIWIYFSISVYIK